MSGLVNWFNVGFVYLVLCLLVVLCWVCGFTGNGCWWLLDLDGCYGLGLLVDLLVASLLIVLWCLFYSIWCYNVSIGLWMDVCCCFVYLVLWFIWLWCFCLVLIVVGLLVRFGWLLRCLLLVFAFWFWFGYWFIWIRVKLFVCGVLMCYVLLVRCALC